MEGAASLRERSRAEACALPSIFFTALATLAPAALELSATCHTVQARTLNARRLRDAWGDVQIQPHDSRTRANITPNANGHEKGHAHEHAQLHVGKVRVISEGWLRSGGQGGGLLAGRRSNGDR